MKGKGSQLEAGQGKKHETLTKKQTKAKRAGARALGKCEALSSIPSTTKNKARRKWKIHLKCVKKKKKKKNNQPIIIPMKISFKNEDISWC
jgi:hypothetical protein